MTVHSLWQRTLLVIPIRIVLGVALLVAARIAGSNGTAALLAFVTGLVGIVFFLFNDPRARFAPGAGDALPFPEDVAVAPRWRQAFAATLPSTIGVAVLSVIALFTSPTLSALLAGIETGLGVAAALSLLRIDPSLYVDPRSRRVYRR
jgi:hypothetical protein